jgi:hypothetical protein
MRRDICIRIAAFGGFRDDSFAKLPMGEVTQRERKRSRLAIELRADAAGPTQLKT